MGLRHMVFVEGISGAGKTTLLAALGSWRRDRFIYYDRGPWSRVVHARFEGHALTVRHAQRMIGSLQRISIVIHVLRPVDEVLQCRRLTRERLEKEAEMYATALGELPPAHLLEIHNSRLTPEDMLRQAQEQLATIAPLDVAAFLAESEA